MPKKSKRSKAKTLGLKSLTRLSRGKATLIGVFALVLSAGVLTYASSYGNIQVKSYIDDPNLPGVADVAVSGKLVQLKPGCNYGAWTRTWNTFHGCLAGRTVAVLNHDYCVRDPRTGKYFVINQEAKFVTVKAGSTVTANFIYGPASAKGSSINGNTWSVYCKQNGAVIVGGTN